MSQTAWHAEREEPQIIDRLKVSENTWAHVAVCGNEVFIRQLNAMVVSRCNNGDCTADTSRSREGWANDMTFLFPRVVAPASSEGVSKT